MSPIIYRNEDSFCGPISMLTRLGDGGILLAFREAKWRGWGSHLDPTTRVSSLRSYDEGRTWISPVTIDSAGGNGCAVTTLSDGILLANAFHWVTAPIEHPERLAGMPLQRKVDKLGLAAANGGVYFTRSETDGYTWAPQWRVADLEGVNGLACYSPPLELDGGELLLPVIGESRMSIALRSTDHGLNWGSPSFITDDADADMQFHETRLARNPSGQVLAMHRTPDGNYFRNFSDDNGYTWSDTEDTGIWCEGSSPPDLRILSDGRLLLTRGYRKKPFGVRARVSEDGGHTWENPIVLRDDGADRDVGYPSTIELDDGSLLTAYYWHDHDDIRHLQQTRWRI